MPPPGAARPAGAPPLVSAPGGYGVVPVPDASGYPGAGGYGVVPVPGVGGNSGAGGYGGPGAGGPGPADRAGAVDPAGSPRKADLEWWERLGARLRSWRALVVLRRIQAVVVWASLPVILVALMVNETLRISLGAWLGTMWVVFVWFWMARTKSVSWRLISGVFAASMPWAGAVGLLSLRLVAAAGISAKTPAATIVVAGVAEELCKLAPLAVLALAAPGRMRRLLVCDWLLLGVAAGAGFAAVEEILRRIAYLSAPSTPGLMLATALCPPGASQMLKCLGLPTFGLSPFSGSFPTALSYSGHAMVTGMVAACIGLGRHLWWRCGSRAGRSGGAGAVVGRVLSPLVPLLALWVAIADHLACNASTRTRAWGETGGEAPWPLVDITSTLTGGGQGRGWLVLILLVVGAVLDARVLCYGGYDDGLLDDLGVCEGRVGGGAIGAWRWRVLARLPRSGVGRWTADVIDALVLPWLEWRLVVRAAGEGKVLNRFRLPICTVVGLRRERDAAARAVLDPGRQYRWVVRVLAALAVLAGVLVLMQVPTITHDLNRQLAPHLGGGWLAGVLDMLGDLWDSLSPMEQGLLMLAAGALVVFSGGGLGLAFDVGLGLAMLGSAHDAARFVRDPQGTIARYLSSHTPGEIALDVATWIATMVAGGGVGAAGGTLRYGVEAARESRRWRRAKEAFEEAARRPVGRRPAYAYADPRRTPHIHRGVPDDGVMRRSSQGGSEPRRRAQPEPRPEVDPRAGVDRGDNRDYKGQFTDGNKGAHAYDFAEWQVRENYRRLAEKRGHPLRELLAEKRLAQVNGSSHGRYYDGLAQRDDGTWVGIEAKYGTSPYRREQKAFDDLVSPDNPAIVTLGDGRVIKITRVYVERIKE